MEKSEYDIAQLFRQYHRYQKEGELTGRRESGSFVNGFKATSKTATQFNVGENPGVLARSRLTYSISHLLWPDHR
jgi:hypothetical protein